MSDQRPRILVIDDMPANLLTLGAALATEFDLQAATSGAMGLVLAAESPPDLILLDVMMPEMDGFETFSRLQADPNLKDITVIFVTALSDLDSEAKGLALGAADYITKPLNVKVARQRIRNLLERERLRKEVKAQRNQLEVQLVTLKHSQMELRDSEFRWRFAIEGSGDGLWDWNVEDRTVFFSGRWKEMLGFSEDEIGHGLEEWDERIHPEDKAEILAVRQAYFDGNVPIYVREYRVRCKDGSYKWILDRGMVVCRNEDGYPLRMIGTHTDITERKQAVVELSEALEAAKLSDKAKDEFLANITHELRTPLSAVIGFSNLARSFCTDHRQHEYLDKVNSAGNTLSHIIDDLLDLSKIAAGRMELEVRPFRLRQLVMRSRSVISYKAQEKGLELVEWVDDEIPDVLVGDGLRVEQILLNLLSNAVKFTVAGQVALRVGLRASEAPRVCLNIEVEDQGIGLSEAEIARLFNPFSQADASMTRKFGGTGLGLAICKRLAELMDGEISVSSREGRGSIFRVNLWLGLAETGELPAEADSVPGQELAPVRYQDVRVLVVDDQPFNREVVEALLAAVGITTYLAENGLAALDILAGGTETFDLILMDIQMPVMDGLAATRAIRSLAGFAQLPIIAMTAHTMAHERAKSVSAGMNDHIGKPFDEAGFYRVLAKWIPRGKQCLQTTAATRPAPASRLPPLRGVDTRAGLALLQGNEARYCHWLGDFIAQAPSTMLQIRQDLLTEATESASMAAHCLKGRSGQLGMNELHAIAGALETAIAGAQPTDELLLDLENGVAAMCAEIQGWIGLADSATAAAEALPDILPPGLPPACVTQLIASLHAGDGDCDRFVADCLAELEDTAWAPHLRQTLRHIQNYDFAAASRVLSDDRQEPAQGNSRKTPLPADLAATVGVMGISRE